MSGGETGEYDARREEQSGGGEVTHLYRRIADLEAELELAKEVIKAADIKVEVLEKIRIELEFKSKKT